MTTVTDPLPLSKPRERDLSDYESWVPTALEKLGLEPTRHNADELLKSLSTTTAEPLPAPSPKTKTPISRKTDKGFATFITSSPSTKVEEWVLTAVIAVCLVPIFYLFLGSTVYSSGGENAQFIEPASPNPPTETIPTYGQWRSTD